MRSLAPSCQKVLEGSGFVIAPDRVMTNAHVVAGSSSVQVYASGNPLDATVVSYDPSVDIAILAVPNLPPPPLAFAEARGEDRRRRRGDGLSRRRQLHRDPGQDS